jgi:2',3'-cyclic-nucleotide 2'-phosphodiesterase (5'-nucleotidase family)
MTPRELLWLLALTCQCLASPPQLVLQQPEASEPLGSPHRPLDFGQLNVIATTDTHGWIRGHLGSAEPEPNASGGAPLNAVT